MQIQELTSLQTLQLNEIVVPGEPGNDFVDHPMVFMPRVNQQLPNSAMQDMASSEDIPVEIYDLWDDTDLSDWNTKYAPKTPMHLTSREHGSTLRMHQNHNGQVPNLL